MHPTNNALIRKNHHLKRKLAQKLYDEYAWHLNISKSSVTQFFVHLTSLFIFILSKFYCCTSLFVLNIETKLVVLKLTTRWNECQAITWANSPYYSSTLFFDTKRSLILGYERVVVLVSHPTDNHYSDVIMSAMASQITTSASDKPLSEPMLTRLTDTYVRHYGEMG